MRAAIACLAIAGCHQIPRNSAPKGGGDARKLSSDQAADVQFALGRSLEAQGDLAKAAITYREVARRDPKRADAPLRLAIVLDREGRFAESEPYYKAALKASPGDPQVFCDRGYSLALQGRDAEAEVAFRQAIAKDPEMARAHNNLGLLLGRTGRPDEALAEFRKSGCPEADARHNLAFALSLDRKWDEARQHLAIARGLDPRIAAEPEGGGLDAMIAAAEAKGPGADPALMQAGGGRPD